VGIHFDGVTTSEFAGWGPHREINEKLDQIFARFAETAYERFIAMVAASRSREVEHIRSIAGGRVWLAPSALERGLVDQLGGFEDAVAAAAKRAGLEDYRVHYIEKEPTALVALLRRFSDQASIDLRWPRSPFARRLSPLLEELDGLDRPRASVFCTVCLVEMP
jgi:protease-4